MTSGERVGVLISPAPTGHCQGRWLCPFGQPHPVGLVKVPLRAPSLWLSPLFPSGLGVVMPPTTPYPLPILAGFLAGERLGRQ